MHAAQERVSFCCLRWLECGVAAAASAAAAAAAVGRCLRLQHGWFVGSAIVIVIISFVDVVCCACGLQWRLTSTALETRSTSGVESDGAFRRRVVVLRACVCVV